MEQTMKNLIFTILISILAITGCSFEPTSNCTAIASQINNEADLLGFYRQYSTFTDPGEYEYLYENLPDSLPELCQLIQKQFMHIVTEYPSYKDIMPGDSRYDITKYTTIESILETLYQKDSNGLTLYRKPENRLVFSCQNYALMLES